ncbi:MAG: hypothetical protein JRG86_10715 [Deltaproteobacteria bacterium]|jgi:hypothetical protein|nr:hypothetical protein [Deltaproteobacteria bacterium]MBW2496562.1 hypothetical protein [Deltaproteobacteria bacterium]
MGRLKIENAIDLHCHYGPDMVGAFGDGSYGVTALEAATEAAREGYAALVLKAHDFATPALAFALQQVVPDVRVFGGLTLDYQAGGVNPAAVESALGLGAKIVWLPTLASAQDYRNGIGRELGYPAPGLSVLDERGALIPAVREIMQLVAEHDAILATGHTSAEEHHAVAKEFGRRGKVLLTHAGERAAGPGLSPAQCRELADLGATVELTALCCASVNGQQGKSFAEMVEMIEAVGPARCTLASDYGWSTAVPHPATGLHDFLDALWSEGVPEADLERMASANPAALLGLAV